MPHRKAHISRNAKRQANPAPIANFSSRHPITINELGHVPSFAAVEIRKITNRPQPRHATRAVAPTSRNLILTFEHAPSPTRSITPPRMHADARCPLPIGTRPRRPSSHSCARSLLPAFVLAAIALAPAGAAFAGEALYAFGSGRIAIPSNTAVGTVVARDYFTPTQLCGKATCDITFTYLYAKGSLLGSANGPEIETTVDGLSTRVLIDGVPLCSTTVMTLRRSVEVQLLRDARVPKNGTLKPSVLNSYFTIRYKSGLFGDSSSIYLAADAEYIAGTCSVQSKTVQLPGAKTTEFSGVGSTAHPTPFTLNLSNCPARFNKIGYQLNPLNGEVAGMPGVLAPRSDSTAKGIAIGLIDPATNQPLAFNVSRPTPYNGIAGSYSVPLIAAYQQTDAKIGGGSVNAAVTVLLDYQ
ncbi:fimbrial protein [Burkholderia metallica]